MQKHGYNPRKTMGMGGTVPWDDLDNLNPDPGAFGISTYLGGKAPRSSGMSGTGAHLKDSQRCCPPPVGTGRVMSGGGMGNQANPIHVQKMPR